MKAAAIILAAGRSTRMGDKNKLLLEIEPGRPMVRLVAELAAKADVDEILVVIGHQAEEVKAALAGIECSLIHNPDFAEGLSSSLKAGFANAVAARADGAVILLGDMPFVTAETIARVLEKAQRQPDRMVQPLCGGTPAHPVWLPARLALAINRLEGDAGARNLGNEELGDKTTMEVEGTAAVDIDTQEAYAEAVQSSSHRR